MMDQIYKYCVSFECFDLSNLDLLHVECFASLFQSLQNNLELDQFENSVRTNYDWKASIAGKTVSDGNNPQIKVEDITSPVTVRMRTACLGQ